MSEDDATGNGDAQNQGPGRVITDFIRVIVGGYLAPRRSARAVLDRAPEPKAIALMVLLAYLIGKMFETIVPLDLPGGDAGFFAGHASQLIQTGFSFFLFTGLVFGVGRMMGGVGTFLQSGTIVGWHALVTSFLTPFYALVIQDFTKASEAAQLGVDPEISGGVLFIGTFTTLTWMWLLANYVAELHGFRRVTGVLGVMLGLMMTVGFLFASLLGGV